MEQQEQSQETQDLISCIINLFTILITENNSENILIAKFIDISTLLNSVLVAFQENAFIVKSLFSCFEVLLIQQKNIKIWNDSFVLDLFKSILNFACLDDRPKVRKRAGEAIKQIIASPPSPMLFHPATLIVVEFANFILSDYLESSKGLKFKKDENSQVLDTLVFLKLIIFVFVKQSNNPKVSAKLDQLCKTLLQLPIKSSGAGDSFLTQWVFQVLTNLLDLEHNGQQASSSLKKSFLEHNGQQASSSIKKKSFLTPKEPLEDSLRDKASFSLVSNILSCLTEMKPHQNDAILAPAWLKLMQLAFVRAAEIINLAELDQEQEIVQFGKTEFSALVWTFYARVFDNFLLSTTTLVSGAQSATVQLASVSTLVALTNTCVLEGMMNDAKNVDGIVAKMVIKAGKALSDVGISGLWGHVLQICTALFTRLGRRAPSLSSSLLKQIIEFRDDPKYGDVFPFKAELETCLASAVWAIGIDGFAQIISLNIESSADSKTAGPKRPYLLSTFFKALTELPPLMPCDSYLFHVNSEGRAFGDQSLAFFVDTIHPLATRLLKKSADLLQQGRALESKLYETIGVQCWRLFPLIIGDGNASGRVCFDFVAQFPKAAPLLGAVLTGGDEMVYLKQVENEVRSCVCRGLEVAASAVINLSLLQVTENDDSFNTQQRIFHQLSTQYQTFGSACKSTMELFATRFLSAVCNLYISPDISALNGGKSAKGQALQISHERHVQGFEGPIKRFLELAGSNNVCEFFMTMMKSVLQRDYTALDNIGTLSLYASFDLLLLFLPYLGPLGLESANGFDESCIGVLYQVLLGQIDSQDASLQKKTYKCLHQLFESYLPIDQIDSSAFVEALLKDDTVGNITSGSAKNRVRLLQAFVEKSNDSAILHHFVPLCLPEIMLATKEASEKTRDCAYSCIISFARKMLSLSEHTDTVQAEGSPVLSLKEFFIMVTAGLGGSTAHMQSAAIASLGRLLFEFSDDLDLDLVSELIKTVLITMSFKNREVTKAALGFIKVAIVCLSLPQLSNHLEIIITTILTHTREHKSHFKSKVRHIFERLIRRFSYEQIDAYFPEKDKKLIANIKKRRDAMKKKQAAAKLAPSISETAPVPLDKKPKLFEEAFHDSGSELGSDDEDDYIPEQFKDEAAPKLRKGQSEAVIREGGQVVDFLDRNVVSQISHTNSKVKSRSGKLNFTTNKQGKIIVAEEGLDSANVANTKKPEISEDYYKQSLASEVAFTRSADGKVKFLKRKRLDEKEGIDNTYENGQADKAVGKRWHSNNNKKKEGPETDYNQMLGRQYKAKKARGDVKKSGMADPYAYIPLTGKIVGNMNKSTRIDGTLKGILKAAQKGGDVPVKGQSGKPFKGISKANKKHNK